MMTIKRSFLTLFLSSFVLISFSQEKDFGIWCGINTEYDIFKKLELDVSAMLRTFNQASEIEQVFIEGGLTYKVTKYLSVAGAYRFSKTIEEDVQYYRRHKWFADVKGSFDLSDISSYVRFRFQEQRRTYYEDEEDKLPRYHCRIKFKSTYKTPSFPVNPYLEFESFLPVFSDKERVIGKNRFSAGIEYKFNKTHAIELEYMYECDYIPRKVYTSIICLEYNLKF